MEEIKWLEVAVNTSPERLDEVCAKLTAAGMAALVIEDEGEFQQFLEQNRQYWDYVDSMSRGWTASTPPPPSARTTGPTAGRSTISP